MLTTFLLEFWLTCFLALKMVHALSNSGLNSLFSFSYHIPDHSSDFFLSYSSVVCRSWLCIYHEIIFCSYVWMLFYFVYFLLFFASTKPHIIPHIRLKKKIVCSVDALTLCKIHLSFVSNTLSIISKANKSKKTTRLISRFFFFSTVLNLSYTAHIKLFFINDEYKKIEIIIFFDLYFNKWIKN